MLSLGIPRRLRPTAAMLAVVGLAACGTYRPPAVQPAPPDSAARALAGADVLTRAQIDLINPHTMTDLIDGRFSGVQVVYTAGRPIIMVRGLANPLIVLDNVPLSDPQEIWSLNPHDVERIEVLKDGDASIWGSRGGRG